MYFDVKNMDTETLSDMYFLPKKQLPKFILLSRDTGKRYKLIYSDDELLKLLTKIKKGSNK